MAQLKVPVCYDFIRISKRGGGVERVRQLQATLTQIFIVLESESHGLSEIEKNFSAKIGYSNGFSAPKQVIFTKKRSSPKLRRVFRPKSEIQTLFQAESRKLLHNVATQISLGGCFHFFTKNRPQKHQKRAILHALHTPPLWLRY